MAFVALPDNPVRLSDEHLDELFRLRDPPRDQRNARVRRRAYADLLGVASARLGALVQDDIDRLKALATLQDQGEYVRNMGLRMDAQEEDDEDFVDAEEDHEANEPGLGERALNGLGHAVQAAIEVGAEMAAVPVAAVPGQPPQQMGDGAAQAQVLARLAAALDRMAPAQRNYQNFADDAAALAAYRTLLPGADLPEGNNDPKFRHWLYTMIHGKTYDPYTQPGAYINAQREKVFKNWPTNPKDRQRLLAYSYASLPEPQQRGVWFNPAISGAAASYLLDKASRGMKGKKNYKRKYYKKKYKRYARR